MAKVTNKRYKNRKHANFHTEWKRLIKKRQQDFRDRLRNQQNERNVSLIEQEESIHSITPLNDELKSWAIENRISMIAVDKLLLILRSNGHSNLPKSYRTLLNTPRRIELQSIGEAKYWYRGLADCLNSAFSHLDRHMSIKLKFNVDGLPIFNNSPIQFWPILFSVEGKYLIE